MSNRILCFLLIVALVIPTWSFADTEIDLRLYEGKDLPQYTVELPEGGTLYIRNDAVVRLVKSDGVIFE